MVLIAVAILARGWGSVFTAGLTIASIVYGPMLGAFLLGVLTTWATETGAIAGIGVSLAAMIAVHLFTRARVDLVRAAGHGDLRDGGSGGEPDGPAPVRLKPD